jgi:hypothetical protein
MSVKRWPSTLAWSSDVAMSSPGCSRLRAASSPAWANISIAASNTSASSPGFPVLRRGNAKRGTMTDMREAKGPFGGSSHSSASAEDVWAVWTNPAEWPGDVIVMAKIDRPFAVGAKITMRVKGHPTLRLTVTRIEAPMLWTAVARAPGLTETIDHLIDPTDSGTLITQRTVFTGPLASIAARLLGGTVRKTFEATTVHFGRLAETRASQ